ncbi:ribokinase [Cribrihabitans pelagius]|uniref:ribokinase n=1 Tax=Cribrihabitans pelagius TaxID=1765746 RepID=UPI003B5A5460
MSEVTVVGSVNMDLTSYLDRWPQAGETIATRETVISLGGKGANQAVAASRLGAGTSIIGAVGQDGFGADAMRELRGHGVNLHLAAGDDGPTGMAFIDVGPDGQNLIRISAGANAQLTPQMVGRHSRVLSGSRVVLLQNEIPLEASLKAAQLARAAGAVVIMDPAPAPAPFWPAEVLPAFDILTPNAHEAEMITGHLPRSLSEAQEAARKLHTHGATGCIVTMGHLGVAWVVDGQAGQREAPKVASIDTVAAGDCFNGAFAAAYAAGKPIAAAVETAVAAAALATTRKGAAASLPDLDELQSAMA